MSKLSGVVRLRPCASFAVGFFAVASVWATGAEAVSLHVKLACSRDYYAYCSQFASDSPEVRQCMRSVGRRLSERCFNALVDAGEVSPTEVARRAAALRQ
ncbi:hypothetical protein RLW55_02760 [Hyphomicrobium sp. B1]|uniref:hypothetical protein n=1 Tax=Hyphomicrobium sp. B1 TaxID=3075651 RepID=UPI003C2C302F